MMISVFIRNLPLYEVTFIEVSFLVFVIKDTCTLLQMNLKFGKSSMQNLKEGIRKIP